MQKLRGEVKDWLVYPVVFSAIGTAFVWMVVSFLAWDFSFMVPGAFRAVFAAQMVLLWSAVITVKFNEITKGR